MNRLGVQDTPTDTLNRLCYHNWWHIREPVHFLVWGEAIARPDGASAMDPKDHYWVCNLKVSAYNVCTGTKLAMNPPPERRCSTHSDQEFTGCNGGNPFKDMVRQTADEFSLKLAARAK